MAFDIIVYLTAENLDQSYIGWLREATNWTVKMVDMDGQIQ